MKHITKRILRRIFCPFSYSFEDKVIVVSTGRSGSTLLFKAIADSYVTQRINFLGRIFPNSAKRQFSAFITRLSDINQTTSPIVKSHDLYPKNGYRNAKYIFIHGDPLESILSIENIVKIEGMQWFYAHQKHLQASGRYEDRYTQDVLNYKGQLASWASKKRENVYVVSYENLWESVDEISEFLDFKITLPKKRDRILKTVPSNISLGLFCNLAAIRLEIANTRTENTYLAPENDKRTAPAHQNVHI